MEEVQLILLRSLGLHHHMQLLLERRDLAHSKRQLALEVVDFVLENSPVSVESRSQVAGFLLGLQRLRLALF